MARPLALIGVLAVTLLSLGPRPAEAYVLSLVPFDDWAADLAPPAWPSRRIRNAPLIDGVEYELHL